MKPLISIYGTVFNNANIVRKSLDSVISKLPDFREKFEMVIVDNYSTDGTYEILKEYQKRYSNIKIIQEKCTRGKGRAIAFDNTTGRYVLKIDFDTVYLEPFKSIVYNYKKIKPNEIYPMFMMRRETMNAIGNWKNLNYAEDMELNANAISNGLKVYSIPCAFFENETQKNREKRYSKGYKYIKRQLKNYADMISGGGLNLLDLIYRHKNHNKIKIILLYLFCKIINPKKFRHSKKYNNEELVYHNSLLISPKKLRIKNKYWIEVVHYGRSSEDIIKTVYTLCHIGLNQTRLITHNSKSLLILYHKTADKNIIKRKINHFKVNTS